MGFEIYLTNLVAPGRCHSTNAGRRILTEPYPKVSGSTHDMGSTTAAKALNLHGTEMLPMQFLGWHLFQKKCLSAPQKIKDTIISSTGWTGSQRPQA